MTTPDRFDETVDRLIRESPKLHFYSEDDVRREAKYAKKYGYALSAGPATLSVHPDVLRLFPKYAGSNSLTLETGCGYTTIALAALSKHHVCISPDKVGRHLVEQYMDAIGLPRHKVTFIEQSSESALPTLSLDGQVDFAYVDGCHGYPFPALDWHFIDKHLKVKGYIGFDNVEIPTVKLHCDFLEANRAYILVNRVIFGGRGGYQVNIYQKEKDEPREWVFQQFNERKLPSPVARVPGRIERALTRVLPWRLVQVPLRKRFGWPRGE